VTTKWKFEDSKVINFSGKFHSGIMLVPEKD